MSRSPTESVTKEKTTEYIDAWHRLGQMVQQGRSFSGNERNCCFINTRSRRFADASAATGLDLIDDSRTIALSDWDHDGDVDLWIANRTGPRIRLLRNDMPSEHHFLMLRLIGDGKTCNRDAIGARVEVQLAGQQKIKFVKTVRAGDGFLSQSSKWLHFGLSDYGQVDRVVVRWPGQEKVEIFTDLQVDHRFILTQGSGQAKPAQKRNTPVKLTTGPVRPALVTEQARVRLSRPLRIEKSIPYRGWDGHDTKINRQSDENRPDVFTLVNLWSTSCQPCLAEIKQLAGARSQLKKNHIRVVLLNVDSLTLGKEFDSSVAKKVLRGLGVDPSEDFAKGLFASGIATAELIAQLNALAQQQIYRRRQLPLPSSLLLDPMGRLIVVYRGPTTSKQISEDVKLTGGLFRLRPDPTRPNLVNEVAIDMAVPFRGRWFKNAFGNSPAGHVDVLLAGGYPEEALALMQTVLNFEQELPASKSPDEKRNRRLRRADIHLLFGQIHLARRDYAAAENAFQKSLAEKSDLKTSRDGLAKARHEWAQKLDHQGDSAEAVVKFRLAIAARPNWVDPQNALARLLATHPNSDLRDGRAALALAERICQATNHRQADLLDTLAAAQAELGQFKKAFETSDLALRLANETGQKPLAEGIFARNMLYKNRKPYRRLPGTQQKDPK